MFWYCENIYLTFNSLIRALQGVTFLFYEKQRDINKNECLRLTTSSRSVIVNESFAYEVIFVKRGKSKDFKKRYDQMGFNVKTISTSIYNFHSWFKRLMCHHNIHAFYHCSQQIDLLCHIVMSGNAGRKLPCHTI